MRKPTVILSLPRKWLWMVGAICLFLLCGFLLPGRPQAVSVVSMMAGPSDQELRSRLELMAQEINTPPINAKKDPVWKAIPGLNGLELDVDASLEKAHHAKAGEQLPLVVKQIPPHVQLKDLGSLPIYRGNPQKKQMALMINVAWGTEYIPDILDILDQYGVKATFFFDGSWTNKEGAVAKSIAERGHEIGNHAYSHPDLSKYGAAATQSQITRTNEAIVKATGVKPTLFAPPAGAFNQTTVDVAHRQGMKTILWTLDTVDWKKPPAGAIVNRIVPKAQNGALVLMHPTEPTRDALRTLIPALQKKGYGLVTVSQLLDETRPIPTP